MFSRLSSLGLFLATLFVSGFALAISFEEAEKLDRVEGSELLGLARSAIKSGSFGSARSYITQARNKGVAASQVRAVETELARAEERAEEARRQEEARQQAATAAANSGSGGGGAVGRGSPTYVIVETSCVTGRLCPVSGLSISGPSSFSPIYRNAGSGNLSNFSRPVAAGRYSYSFLIDGRCVASGSFDYDGRSGNVSIGHYSPSSGRCDVSHVRQN